MVKRQTARDRFSRALKRVTDGCRRNRHEPVKQQWQTLSRKLRGHFGYYGITGNSDAIHRFHDNVQRIWHKWLDRRSNRARMSWDRMALLLKRYPLPPARLIRPFAWQHA